jgi:hypothetical protein
MEPNEIDLLDIPASAYREWQVDPKGARRARSRIYSLNRNNEVWRWRTMYESGILRVFKFERW